MKKLLLSLGNVAIITVPIAAVVACGDNIDNAKAVKLPSLTEVANDKLVLNFKDSGSAVDTAKLKGKQIIIGKTVGSTANVIIDGNTTYNIKVTSALSASLANTTTAISKLEIKNNKGNALTTTIGDLHIFTSEEITKNAYFSLKDELGNDYIVKTSDIVKRDNVSTGNYDYWKWDNSRTTKLLSVAINAADPEIKLTAGVASAELIDGINKFLEVFGEGNHKITAATIAINGGDKSINAIQQGKVVNH